MFLEEEFVRGQVQNHLFSPSLHRWQAVSLDRAKNDSWYHSYIQNGLGSVTEAAEGAAGISSVSIAFTKKANVPGWPQAVQWFRVLYQQDLKSLTCEGCILLSVSAGGCQLCCLERLCKWVLKPALNWWSSVSSSDGPHNNFLPWHRASVSWTEEIKSVWSTQSLCVCLL